MIRHLAFQIKWWKSNSEEINYSKIILFFFLHRKGVRAKCSCWQSSCCCYIFQRKVVYSQLGVKLNGGGWTPPRCWLKGQHIISSKTLFSGRNRTAAQAAGADPSRYNSTNVKWTAPNWSAHYSIKRALKGVVLHCTSFTSSSLQFKGLFTNYVNSQRGILQELTNTGSTQLWQTLVCMGGSCRIQHAWLRWQSEQTAKAIALMRCNAARAVVAMHILWLTPYVIMPRSCARANTDRRTRQ